MRDGIEDGSAATEIEDAPGLEESDWNRVVENLWAEYD
jgi:hypothetical protein